MDPTSKGSSSTSSTSSGRIYYRRMVSSKNSSPPSLKPSRRTMRSRPLASRPCPSLNIGTGSLPTCAKSGDSSIKKVWVHLLLQKPKNTLETLGNTKLSSPKLGRAITLTSFLPLTRRRLMNARPGCPI